MSRLHHRRWSCQATLRVAIEELKEESESGSHNASYEAGCCKTRGVRTTDCPLGSSYCLSKTKRLSNAFPSALVPLEAMVMVFPSFEISVRLVEL